MFKCILCGKEIESSSHLELDITNHLRNYHFISYQEYYEIIKTTFSETLCWRCGASKYQLCPYIDDYYLPCRACASDKKPEIQEVIKTISGFIKSYQKEVERNKYYQFLLSNDDIIKECLPKSLSEISILLEKMRVRDKIKIVKETTLSISRVLGAPSEISSRNFDNLKLESKDDLITTKTKFGFDITINSEKYSIMYPEECEYDVRHHSRHSILNLKSKRNTKKLKLEGGSCIKLWNTKYSWYKSILLIKDEKDNIVDPLGLTDSEYYMIRLAILKNKPLLRKIFEIYNELCKYVQCLKDSVFIKNSVFLGNSGKIDYLQFTWRPEYTNEPNQINLSLL